MTLKLSDFQEGEVQEVERPKKGLAAGAGTFAKGVPVGVAKSFVGETGLGAGQIGRGIQRGISKAGEAVFGRFNPFRMGGESMFDPEQAQRIRETTLAANAPGQGTGKFIGTALQFLAPTSRITQGQQILGAAARQVPTRVGRTVAGAAARFLPEAAGTGAVAAVRSGGDLEQAKQEGITAGAFSVGLGALGGLARATYWPTLEDSVSKALGSQGKRSGGAALRQTAEKVTGLKVLKDRAADLTVTLDDGSKAAFNPDNASYSTTLQAWNEAKNKIFDEYTSLSTKAGEKATLNLADVRQQIANALEAPLVDKEINAVRSVLADFDRIFKDPNSVDMKTAERFVKSLNENMAEGFFKGTAEGASSKVYAGTSKLIREKLDEIITESEGPGYQALRSQYAALKSIEDDLVRKFQQDARSIGGGLPEYTGAFASGDIIGSALSLDPAQFAKGATLGTFAVLKRRLSNPERFLRRSFDLIDDVPSDLNLRIWGGSRPLSAAEQKAAGDVAESVSNPAVGMSIRKSVTPESVARNADREDIRLLARVVDDVSLAKTDPDVRRVLSDMGLSRATDDELVRFAKDVIDESEGVGSRTVNQSFNQGATPSTNLLENIDERLQPLVDKDGMIDVYRVAAKHPKDVYPKDTFFATKENTARYYGESWHKGNPADLEMRKIKIPANLLKRGGSNDAWQLKEDVPVSGFQSASTNLLEEAKKYKTAKEIRLPNQVEQLPNKLFHGTEKESVTTQNIGDGMKVTWFAEDKNISSKYIGGGEIGKKGNVLEFDTPQNLKIYDAYSTGEGNYNDSQWLKSLEEQGYDGVRMHDAVRFEIDLGSGPYWDKKAHPSVGLFPSGVQKLKK